MSENRDFLTIYEMETARDEAVQAGRCLREFSLSVSDALSDDWTRMIDQVLSLLYVFADGNGDRFVTVRPLEPHD